MKNSNHLSRGQEADPGEQATTGVFSPSRIAAALIGGIALFVAEPSWGQNVIAWGDNAQGQTNVPPAATNVIAVAAGWYHSLALRDDGTVVSWGALTDVPADLKQVTSIAAGSNVSLALGADGSVVAWGDNTYGQTVVPDSATNVVAIAAGYNHCVALRSDGTVVAWGKNDSKQTQVPAGCTNVLAIAAAAEHSLALRDDGSVITWGGNCYTSGDPFGMWDFPNPAPLSIREMLGISAGLLQNLGISRGGQLAWGIAAKPFSPRHPTNLIATASGPRYDLALTADGKPLVWGGGPATNMPAGLTNITAIAAGFRHGLAVTADGQAPRVPGPVYYRNFAQAGNPLPLFVHASGARPLHYQWLADGTAIPNTDSPYPDVPAMLGSDNVEYQVVVSNAFGSATSSVTRIKVLPVNVWGDYFNGIFKLPEALVRPRMLAAGGYHILAQNEDGSLIGWGKNADGQINIPGDATNVTAMAAGGNHSLALRSDGSVVAWGRNWDGEATVPASAANVVAVAAGWAHSLALRGDGTVLAWGNNEYDQTNVPVSAANVIAIAAGYYHSMALRANGTVVTWGWDVPVPAEATNLVAIAAGWEHCVALRADGTVVAWGDNTFGQSAVPASATNIVALQAGYYHTVAMRADGTVITWGKNATTRLQAPPGLRNATCIAAGEDFCAALVGTGAPLFTAQPRSTMGRPGGTAVLSAVLNGAGPMSFQWYHNGTAIAGATNRFLLLSNLQAADAGDYQLLASNDAGQMASQTAKLDILSGPLIDVQPIVKTVAPGRVLDLSATVSGAEPLSCQWLLNGIPLVESSRVQGTTTPHLYVSQALLADRGLYSLAVSNAYGGQTALVAQVVVSQVLAWGDNSYGQLLVPAGMSNVVALSVGKSHCLALQMDGTVVAWGDDSFGQASVPPEAIGIVGIAAGGFHSLALRDDGTVIAWGDGSAGQTNVPPEATNVLAIAAGARHSLALRDDGGIVAWGDNSAGQISVPGWAQTVALSAGQNYTLGLSRNGTLSRWGTNAAQPPTTGGIFRIAAGAAHALAITNKTGRVVGWGANYYGQATPPKAATNVIGIACGDDHSLALLKDGSLLAWGANYVGQTSIPTEATNVSAVAAGGACSLALMNDPGTPLPPVVWGQVPARVLSQGTSPMLLARAMGPPPMRFQWYFTTTLLGGQTNSWLSLTNLQPSTSGVYTVVVSNDFGSTTGVVAAIAVSPMPTILIQPTNTTGYIGGSARFSVTVGGATPFHYQWRREGINLTNGWGFQGAQDPSLWISPLAATNAGSYDVIVSNANGAVTSLVAVLSVEPPPNPVILAQPPYPAYFAPDLGTDLSFGVTAAGVEPLSYQWWKDGVRLTNSDRITGTDGPALTLLKLQSGDTGHYYVRVSNPNASVDSETIQVVVQIPQPPWIQRQPISQTAYLGGTSLFDVVPGGGGPYSFIWRKDGLDLSDGERISGSTTRLLQIINLQTNDAADYCVVVSNPCGAVTSSVAHLTALPAPPPVLTCITDLGGGKVRFSFFAVRGVSYEVQSTARLDPPAWREFETCVGHDEVLSFTNWMGSEWFGYFRIKVK